MNTKHSELHPVIRYESACQIVEQVVEQARNLGRNVCAVVVDPSGNVVSAGRMTGVPAPIYDYAADKAYTAGKIDLGFSPTDEQFLRTVDGCSKPITIMYLARRPAYFGARALDWWAGCFRRNG